MILQKVTAAVLQWEQAGQVLHFSFQQVVGALGQGPANYQLALVLEAG